MEKNITDYYNSTVLEKINFKSPPVKNKVASYIAMNSIRHS